MTTPKGRVLWPGQVWNSGEGKAEDHCKGRGCAPTYLWLETFTSPLMGKHVVTAWKLLLCITAY